jgi:hypothetical protein
MQSTMHPNERMQYTSQLQFEVHSHRNQDKVGTYVILDQP